MSRSRSRSLVLPVLMAVALAAVAAPPVAMAATYTLSPGQSIAAKLATVQPGDKILLNQGTYSRVITSKSFNTTAVTIEPVAGAQVTVQGFQFLTGAKNITVRGVALTPSTSNPGVEVNDGVSYITIDNVHVTSGTHGVRSVGGSMTTPSNITITNSEIENVTVDGIQFCGGKTVKVLDNEIHDLVIDLSGETHNDGVQLCGGDDYTISRNLIYDTAPEVHGPNQGIITGRSATNALSNVVVSNNLVHHWPGTGITVSGAANATIVNNTSWASGPTGTGTTLAVSKNKANLCPPPAPDCAGYDNTSLKVINNVTYKFLLKDGETVDTFENNVIRFDGGGAGLITADPLFVNPVADPLAADFSLQPTSPAIDQGSTNAVVPSVDLRNQPRFVPDRGAIEYMLHDTFTGTAGTSLSSHVGEQHAQWTKHPGDPGTAAIASPGRVKGPNTTDIYTYLASWAPPSLDQVVEMKFVFTGTAAGAMAGVVARWDPAQQTGYHLRWLNGAFELYRFDNGQATLLATLTKPLTVNQTYTIRLSARATSSPRIDGYFDGVLVFPNADPAPIQSIGKVGLRGRGTVSWIDSIIAFDP